MREENVREFYVTMNDVVAVHIRNGVEKLKQEGPQRCFRKWGAMGIEELLQITAVAVLHEEVEVSIAFDPNLVEVDNSWMMKSRKCFRFIESRLQFCSTQFPFQSFDDTTLSILLVED